MMPKLNIELLIYIKKRRPYYRECPILYINSVVEYRYIEQVMKEHLEENEHYFFNGPTKGVTNNAYKGKHWYCPSESSVCTVSTKDNSGTYSGLRPRFTYQDLIMPEEAINTDKLIKII